MKCILCRGEMRSLDIVSGAIRDAPDSGLQVVRCPACGHVQLSGRLSQTGYQKFYDEDLQGHSVYGSADLASIGSRLRPDTERRVRWIEGLGIENPSVLDVGSGYGFLVDALARAGYEAVGIDISRERVARARTALNGEHVLAGIEEFVQGHCRRFSVACVFHVLEHVEDPVSFLMQCKEVVRKGGTILIEVPNLDDELLALCQPYRGFFWQRAHLSYFDSGRLGLCISMAGFRRVHMRSVQRYGLLNLVNWIATGEPQLEEPSFEAQHPLLTRVEEMYRRDRESRGVADTLIAEIAV